MLLQIALFVSLADASVIIARRRAILSMFTREIGSTTPAVESPESAARRYLSPLVAFGLAFGLAAIRACELFSIISNARGNASRLLFVVAVAVAVILFPFSPPLSHSACGSRRITRDGNGIPGNFFLPPEIPWRRFNGIKKFPRCTSLRPFTPTRSRWRRRPGLPA